MAKSERTLAMEKEYVELFDKGKTPREIADKFGVSYTKVYQSLPEIAAKAGRTKQSLLERPHKEHEMSGKYNKKQTIKIDAAKFKEDCEKLLFQMEFICNESKKFIQEEEQ